MCIRFEGTIRNEDQIVAQKLNLQGARRIATFSIVLIGIIFLVTILPFTDQILLVCFGELFLMLIFSIPLLAPYLNGLFRILFYETAEYPVRGYITSTGVKNEDEDEIGLMHWEGFKHYKRSRKIVNIYKRGGGYLIFPRTVFFSPTDFGEFVRLVQDNLQRRYG